MYLKLSAVLAFVVAYNILFYQSGVGIITFIFFSLLNGLLFLLRNKESKNTRLALTFSTVSVISSFLFSLSSNELLATLNIFTTIGSIILAFYFYNLGSKFSYSLTEYFAIPLKSAVSFVEGIFAVQKLSEYTKVKKIDTAATSSILRGLLFAVPLGIILLILLIIGDPVYGEYALNTITNFQKFFIGPFWVRLLSSLVVLLIGLSILAALLKLRVEDKNEETKTIDSGRQLELIAFLSLPILIFFSFIIVQFEYLFSSVSERQLALIGIESLTYSEYVRRGFTELMIVSSISLAVIAFVSRFVHRVKNRNEIIIKGLITTLIIQTQILLFSVFWRVMMYQMEHGLTRNRVFGMYILIALAGVLLVYLAKIIINIKQKYLFLSLAAIGFITVSVMTLTNPDRLIAVNFKPTVNERIDHYYISHLSYDAVDGWNNVINEAENALNTFTKDTSLSIDDYYQINCVHLSLMELQHKKDYLDTKYNNDGLKNWRELNLSEYNAFQKIKNDPEYSRIPQLKQTALQLMEDYKKTDQYPLTAYCGSY